MASFGGATIKEAFEATDELVTEFSPVEFDEGETSKIHDVDTDGASAIGIAQESAISGHPADVICYGLAKARIAEPVQSGDELTPNGAGKLRIATTGDYVLARAVQYGGATNDVITVLITHEGISSGAGAASDGIDITVIAGEDLTANQYYIVKIKADINGEATAILPQTGIDNDGIRVAGILQNSPDVNENATVRIIGKSFCVFGETLQAEQVFIVSGSTAGFYGKAINEQAGKYCLGQILTNNDADEIGSVLITHEGYLPAGG